MLIGAHVSTAGGLVTAVERAEERGAESMQIFNQSPRAWRPTKYTSDDFEAALDKLTMLVQQLDETIDRSLTLPPSTSSSVSTQLPPPEANFVIGWNEAEDALINVDPASFATIVAYGTTASDLFSGNGVQTAFTLTHDPASVNNMDVAVGGVTQRPGLDYTWSSGTTMTFSTAPPVGTNNILVRYQLALPIGSSDSSSSLFIQAGAGAVPRTMQDKGRESISALDYWLPSDGSNYSPALTRGITYLVTLGGGELVLPRGDILLNSTVQINCSGISIVGKGAAVTGTRIINGQTNAPSIQFGDGVTQYGRCSITGVIFAQKSGVVPVAGNCGLKATKQLDFDFVGTDISASPLRSMMVFA